MSCLDLSLASDDSEVLHLENLLLEIESFFPDSILDPSVEVDDALDYIREIAFQCEN